MIGLGQILHVSGLDSAPDMWDCLADLHNPSSFDNVFNLKSEFYGLKFSGSDKTSLQKHVQKIKELSYQLTLVGEKISSMDENISFLNSLCPTHDSLVLSIKMHVTSTTPLATTAHRVINELFKSETSGTETALRAQHKKPSQTPTGPRQSQKCSYCGRPGHVVSKCHKKFWEDGHKENVAFKANTDDILAYSSCWIVDSGATSHMSSNRRLFKIFFTLERPIEIYLADESVVYATGMGDVRFTVQGRSILLTNVLYVPKLTSNLISISKLVSKGNEAYINQDGFHCRTGSGEDIKLGELNGNLYTVNGIKVRRATCSLVKDLDQQSDSLKLWHHRLGHLNYQDVIRLSKTAEGIDLSEHTIPVEVCPGCSFGKMCRTPFPPRSNRATKPLEIIHSDICGPMQVSSRSGKRYFITFIDDHTNFTMAFLLRSKAEALEYFKYYVQTSAKRFAYSPTTINFDYSSIKILRSDNGGEYTSTAFDRF
jgi:hypothetical protein